MVYKTMVYRATKKARQQWSEHAIARKAQLRIERCQREPYTEIDHYLKITVERRATGEIAVFECFEGTRIDNYTVYCNDIRQGVQSITTLMANIRKALPRFRRMEE